MRKVIIIALLGLIISIAACRKKDEVAANGENKKVVVGVAKFISHSALDAAEKGFLDEMTRSGMNIEFDIQNANGDVSVNSEIANRFRGKKVDLIYSISTPTTLAMMQQNPDKPIIFALVTDPVGAGIRNTFEPYNTLVNGIDDMPPVAEEMEMIMKVMPGIKRLGLIYSPGEQNSVKQMEMIKSICNENGVELLVSPVNNTAEVKQAAEILAPKVDAFFVSKDNFVVAAITSVSDTAYRYKIPLFTAEPAVSNLGKITVAYGLDSYKSGVEAAKMAIRVLNGEDITKMPVGPVAGLFMYINQDVADELNLTIPQDMIDKANIVESSKGK